MNSESDIGMNPDARAYAIALAVSREPLRQLPICLASIPGYPKESFRMAIVLTRYNMDQFDRLTNKGYRLNMLTETYEKIHD